MTNIYMELASNFGQLIKDIIQDTKDYKVKICRIMNHIPHKLDQYKKRKYREDILNGVHRVTNIDTARETIYEERCFVMDDWLLIIRKHLSSEYIPRIVDYDSSFEYVEYTKTIHKIVFYDTNKTYELQHEIDLKLNPMEQIHKAIIDLSNDADLSDNVVTDKGSR